MKKISAVLIGVLISLGMVTDVKAAWRHNPFWQEFIDVVCDSVLGYLFPGCDNLVALDYYEPGNGSSYNETYDNYTDTDTNYWVASGVNLYNDTEYLEVGIGLSNPLSGLHIYDVSQDDTFDLDEGVIIEQAGTESPPDTMLHYVDGSASTANWSVGLHNDDKYVVSYGEEISDDSGITVIYDDEKNTYLVGINTLNPIDIATSTKGLYVVDNTNVTGNLYVGQSMWVEDTFYIENNCSIPGTTFEAEENSALDINQYEFSFGNGQTGANHDYAGVRQPCPGDFVAFSLQCDYCAGEITPGCNTTVEIRESRTTTNCKCTISNIGAAGASGEGCTATCSEQFATDSYLNFYTVNDSCNCQNCVASIWVRYD